MCLLTSDVQYFMMHPDCSQCRVWTPLQTPGSISRDPGNTWFLEHLWDLFYSFPFQNFLSWIPLWLSLPVIALGWTGDQEINQILWGFCAEYNWFIHYRGCCCLLSHPQPAGYFLSITVCLLETPTAWGCESTASMFACYQDDNDLVSLAGLKLWLCRAGCTPCKQGQAGIWEQPVPGTGWCLCSFLATCCAGPLDPSPAVPASLWKWWKGFLYFLFKSIYCWSYVSTDSSVCSRDSILLSCFASVEISAKTKKREQMLENLVRPAPALSNTNLVRSPWMVWTGCYC